MFKEKWKSVLLWIVVVVFVVVAIGLLLPKGSIIEGEIRHVSGGSVEFLYDLTYEGEDGEVVYEQQIFDRIFEMIDNAEVFVVVDMFLFGASDGVVYRNLTQEFTDHLLAKKEDIPDMKMYFITDYYSVMHYGDDHLRQLSEAGVEVLFSSSTGTKEFGEKDYKNYIFKKFKVRLNHRKTVIADSGDRVVSLVSSANPHDESSPNSNVAFYFEEGIWRDIYGSYKEDLFIEDLELDLFLKGIKEERKEELSIQYLENGGSVNSLIGEIDNTIEGDSIDIFAFLFSDKKTIDALLRASERGVDIRLILDVNVQSFGKEKAGIPNKIAAEKVVEGSDGKIEVRWYKEHGEQFHTKMSIIRKENFSIVSLGSSNIVDYESFFYNLQSDARVVAPFNSSLEREVRGFFDRLWLNENGTYTVDYDEFRNDSFFKRLTYEGWDVLKFIF